MTVRQMQLDAKAEGIAQGRKEGLIAGLIELVKDGLLSVKDASIKAHMSEADFAALVART